MCGWAVQGKVVFLAPTKPLVHQQMDACQQFMGSSKVSFLFCSLLKIGFGSGLATRQMPDLQNVLKAKLLCRATASCWMAA